MSLGTGGDDELRIPIMGISHVVFAYATVTGSGYDATRLGCGADPPAVVGGAGTSARVAGPGAGGTLRWVAAGKTPARAVLPAAGTQ